MSEVLLRETQTGGRPEGSVVFREILAIGALLGLVGPLERWRWRAACTKADYRLFEPADRGESSRGYPPRVLEALRVCESCPVRRECYQTAFQLRHLGVWGGIYRRQLSTASSRSVARTEELVIDSKSGQVLSRRVVRNPRDITTNPEGLTMPSADSA